MKKSYTRQSVCNQVLLYIGAQIPPQEALLYLKGGAALKTKTSRFSFQSPMSNMYT